MPIDSRMLPPHIQKQILRKIAEQDAAKKNPPKPMNKPKMVNPLESMTEIQSNPQSGKCLRKSHNKEKQQSNSYKFQNRQTICFSK